MADITKCNDSECPHKEQCYRWTAPASEFLQSWFFKSPRRLEDNKCAHYWGDMAINVWPNDEEEE